MRLQSGSHEAHVLLENLVVLEFMSYDNVV